MNRLPKDKIEYLKGLITRYDELDAEIKQIKEINEIVQAMSVDTNVHLEDTLLVKGFIAQHANSKICERIQLEKVLCSAFEVTVTGCANA